LRFLREVILGGLISVAALLATLVALRIRRRRRIWLAAFIEQGRREDAHDVSYRHDQRVRAIQQRLSRHWGRRAHGHRVKRRIEEALRGVVK
jgi:hypothetical protein